MESLPCTPTSWKLSSYDRNGDKTPDSPCSDASTHLPSAIDNDEPPRVSVDSLSGMFDSLAPGLSMQRLDSKGPALRLQEQVTRRKFFAAARGDQCKPKDFNATDSALAHRRRSSSVTSVHAPSHSILRSELAPPGPASYSPDDRLQAHHRRFPSATFGQATGHKSPRPATSTPGPADFYTDDVVDARHKRSTRVTIGRGPGHDRLNLGPASSPGPAAYNADDRLLAGHRSFPTCTIGSGPGHASSVVHDPSPAPGSYNLTHGSLSSPQKQTRGCSLARAGREVASAEEHLRFRRADHNCDGELDFTEVNALLQSRFPEIPRGQVRAIFDAADQNHDGKIDFQEVVDYTRSTNPAEKRLREKMSMALATPKCSSSFREGEERMQFRKADLNLDGHLDISELESLMLRCYPDIKIRDVQNVFQTADENHDGKLDYIEVSRYTRSKDPSSRRLREKLQTALAAPFTRSSCEDADTAANGITRARRASMPVPTQNTTNSASRHGSKQNATTTRRASSASAVGSLIASRPSHA